MTTSAVAHDAPPHRRLALGVVLAAVFMDLVDGTIVAIVLPRIQSDLAASFAAAQWILAGYSLTFALTLIPGGRLGDVYGRKRIFLIGLAGFTLTSVVCGAAADPALLIGARLAQGAMAALMVPQAISIITIMFDPGSRAKAFGLYGAVLSLANVSGPLLGALLTQNDLLGLGWRAIFYVNVPIGLIAFAGAVRYMPESRAEQPLRIDIPGIALIGLASFTLMFPLIQGQESGRPLWAILMPIAAAPILVLFARCQRRADSPLVPPGLFRERTFTVGLVLMLILFTGPASLFLILNYGLQQGLGWTLTTTALTGLGWPIGITLTTGIAQRFASTHGRLLIGSGLLVMAASTTVLISVMTARGTAVSAWEIALPLLAAGLGMGMCVSLLTDVIVADIPADSAGAGSGVLNAVLQLGTAIGIALVGLIYAGLADPSGGAHPVTAAPTTLWYNAAAFLVAALLTPLLPRTARRTPS
ncbi:MFS transporter [Rhizohabitans arisaemae]|uniref:MFS transporter n=1 Tax=Rhizohabitans arisaemae TaxID=2720610 RepID=UPI0024B27634|nr:MFS transporter [Rhizohabitans arisaemae]